MWAGPLDMRTLIRLCYLRLLWQIEGLMPYNKKLLHSKANSRFWRWPLEAKNSLWPIAKKKNQDLRLRMQGIKFFLQPEWAWNIIRSFNWECNLGQCTGWSHFRPEAKSLNFYRYHEITSAYFKTLCLCGNLLSFSFSIWFHHSSAVGNVTGAEWLSRLISEWLIRMVSVVVAGGDLKLISDILEKYYENVFLPVCCLSSDILL